MKIIGDRAAEAVVCDVKPNSLAERHGIKAGDIIVSINGRVLRDILDYEMAAADTSLEIEIVRKNGCSSDATITANTEKLVIRNPRYESLGVCFSTSLFDGIKTCRNKCVFCFIDQLPPDMRDAVYVKDDDYRLSFLYGNFVTFTNVSEADVNRIIEDRISPLYVSLHATNPELRARMLGRKKLDKTLEYLQLMSDKGIEMHVQIVLCPGLNDREELERTLEELSVFSGVESVGIVPVGLTGYRDGLHPLRSFEKQEIIELIAHVRRHQERFEIERGCAWVYIADEFYISADTGLPDADHYCEFPQIENGIGLSRLFVDEAEREIERAIAEARGLKNAAGNAMKNVAVITGELFAPVLTGIVDRINDTLCLNSISKTDGAHRSASAIDVIPVKNLFFGGKVTVTGLLTGFDIVEAARNRQVCEDAIDVLLMPDVLLNGDGLLLDGSTPEKIASELGIEVRVLESTGAEAVKGIMEYIGV